MTIGMTRSLADDNLTDALDRSLTSDIFNIAVVCGALNVGTSAVEAKVGASKLANRKGLVITNMSGNTVYWGCSSVTTSAGTPLDKKQSVTITAGASLAIYLISSATTNDVRIVELS